MAYAANTTVPVDRTRAEIEKTLRKAGATNFGTYTNDLKGYSMVQFMMDSRLIRLSVVQPDQEDLRDKKTRRLPRPSALQNALAQEERRRWRALLLIVKAKLELIESKLSTVEREFLADIVLPDNSTVGDLFAPVLQKAYEEGKLPSGDLLRLTAGS